MVKKAFRVDKLFNKSLGIKKRLADADRGLESYPKSVFADAVH